MNILLKGKYAEKYFQHFNYTEKPDEVSTGKKVHKRAASSTFFEETVRIFRSAKNRAFRSNSSDLPRPHRRAAILLSQNCDQPMQILRGFHCNPLRPRG
jgi:hypothetical protein